MNAFSKRHGYDLPEADITVRHEAPTWLRSLVVELAYEAHLKPSDLRSWLCQMLLESPNANNWSEFPNVDGEVRELISAAPWFYVYDLIERVYSQLTATEAEIADQESESAAAQFENIINRSFRKKGIGWQLTDGKIETRGPELFETSVREAIDLAASNGRNTARDEIHEALKDLSRRPEPDLTGAIHHAMAALECVATESTNQAGATLGEWIKKNPSAFPPPLGIALGKLWGFASNVARHVKEGERPSYDQAELVVSIAAALSVYLLRIEAQTKTN